jgi:hypothetical protein
LEIGGILFGVREEGATKILAARPIECEHRFGPSFVLSDNDFLSLEQTLTELRSDPELVSLEPLGAYFSHSRHGVAELTDKEIELYDRLFTNTSPLTFVLIPRSSGLIVHVNLLAKGSDGSHVSCDEFDYSIFTAEPQDAEAAPQIDFRIVPPVEVTNTALRNTTAGRALTMQDDPGVTEERLPPIKSSWPGAIISTAIMVLALAGAGVAYLVWPASPATIPLNVTDRDGNVVIQWDPRLAPLQGASEGSIDIEDGVQGGSKRTAHLFLDAHALRQGLISYRRESEIVRVSFKVGGKEITGLGTTIFMAAKSGAPVTANNASAPAEIVPDSNVPIPSSIPPAPQALEKPANVSSVVAPHEREAPRRSFRAPSITQVKQSNSRPAALPEPPALGGAPIVPNSALIIAALPAPAPPPPAPVRSGVTAAPALPTSGRLIWTGQLAKRAILSFSAAGASSGHLSGWFPPKLPVRVNVHPGELIDGGIVIYTKGEAPRSESPNPGNGWNTVIYKRDDAAAAEIEMLEAPGAANQWNQLVLRNGNRKLSILVLDWAAAK